jgi:hypothetical protein
MNKIAMQHIFWEFYETVMNNENYLKNNDISS